MPVDLRVHRIFTEIRPSCGCYVGSHAWRASDPNGQSRLIRCWLLFDLKGAALYHLARIVRGADTDRLDLAPESAGLLALSLGLSSLHADDHTMLDAALPMYDALYAWCQVQLPPSGRARYQRPTIGHLKQ